MGSGEGQMGKPEGNEGHKRGMVLYLNILEWVVFFLLALELELLETKAFCFNGAREASQKIK